jgi:hypothetical protein
VERSDEQLSHQLNELHVTRTLPLNEPYFTQIPNVEYNVYIMDSLDREARIILALANLANQEHPNFKRTAREFKVNYITFHRRFDSVTAGYSNVLFIIIVISYLVLFFRVFSRVCQHIPQLFYRNSCWDSSQPFCCFPICPAVAVHYRYSVHPLFPA